MINISDSPPKSLEQHIDSFIELCDKTKLWEGANTQGTATTNFVGRLGNAPRRQVKKQSKRQEKKEKAPCTGRPYTGRPRGRPRKRENTRLPYDEPELAALCISQPQRAFKQFQSTMPEQESEKYWVPIAEAEDIPASFYMKDEFREESGVMNVEKESIESAYDAFRLFFDEGVYEMICEKTNSKIVHNLTVETQAYIDGVNPVRPAYNDFRLTDALLDGYFAAQIYRGLVQAPKQKECLQRGEFHERRKSKDGFREDGEKVGAGRMNHIINRRLYEVIRDNLSITDFTLKNTPDPLAKVRAFVALLNANFQEYYAPHEFLAVDEGMIPFSGKLKLRLFNPDKPTQWGIKEFLLCDALHAYTLHVKIHCPDDDPPARLTLQLLEDYADRNHKVVMDNHYTSPQLFTELKEKGIGALGTCKHNRTGLTKHDLEQPHFKRIYPPHKDYANYLSVDNRNVLVYFTSNDKEVALLSSFVDASKNEHDDKNPYPQPVMLHLYNKYKGGCDKRNSLVSHYRYKTSNYKWWRAVFDRMFETAVVNAAVLMKQLFPEKQKDAWLKDFRVSLMRDLIARYHDQLGVVSSSNKKNFKKHTLLEGEKILRCVECGVATRLMCQECTMVQDDVVAVCKANAEACYRYHLCAGVGLHLKKAQDPLSSQEAQHFLSKQMHRKKKTLLTTVTRQELKAMRQQLLEREKDKTNEKNNEKNKEYDRALHLLNEAIARLGDHHEMELTQELSDLLASLDRRDDEEEQDLQRIHEIQHKLHLQTRNHQRKHPEEELMAVTKKLKVIAS